MKKTAKLLLTILLALLLAGGGLFAGANWHRWFGKTETPASAPAPAETDDSAEEWTGEKEVYTGKKNADTIDIPGYGSISLKADEKKQSVNFHNPEQNTCYFRISLLLADGTQLWQSKLISPGKGIYELELTETLEAGAYEDAVLKYECFAMDEAQTPLNGSEIKLTLNVME